MEIRQRRYQPQPRIRTGHVDAQSPAWLAGGIAKAALHFFQLSQQARDARVVGRAIGGDADPPRGAVEQPQAQVRFQLLHQLGDRGAADLQGVRGTGEAAGFHHAGEGAHRLETVHGPGRDCLGLTINLGRSSLFIQTEPASSMEAFPLEPPR